MQRRFQRWVVPGLATMVGTALAAGLIWRRIIVHCDWVAQAGLVLLILILPFIADLKVGFLRHFCGLFFLSFIWCVWRIVYFDPVTHNDPGPSIIYLIAPFQFSMLAGVIFLIRKGALRLFS